MVEHAAVNRGVAGSSPARGAEKQQIICCFFFSGEKMSFAAACFASLEYLLLIKKVKFAIIDKLNSK